MADLDIFGIFSWFVPDHEFTRYVCNISANSQSNINLIREICLRCSKIKVCPITNDFEDNVLLLRANVPLRCLDVFSDHKQEISLVKRPDSCRKIYCNLETNNFN